MFHTCPFWDADLTKGTIGRGSLCAAPWCNEFAATLFVGKTMANVCLKNHDSMITVYVMKPVDHGFFRIEFAMIISSYGLIPGYRCRENWTY